MHSANTITEVYQDEDGWFRFDLITPDGYRIRSGEFAHESNATLDRNYFAARIKEQVEFIANFGPGVAVEAQNRSPSPGL